MKTDRWAPKRLKTQRCIWLPLSPQNLHPVHPPCAPQGFNNFNQHAESSNRVPCYRILEKKNPIFLACLTFRYPLLIKFCYVHWGFEISSFLGFSTAATPKTCFEIKMVDLVRSHFGEMQLWIAEHFFHYRYPFAMKKVFNYSELHLSEVTSYKIHTLA